MLASYSYTIWMKPGYSEKTSNFAPVTIRAPYYIASGKRENQENIFFLFLKENVCFLFQENMLWYSLEVPHRGTSNEYPQHMFL